ncbi:hypothetical protein SKA34_08013 [Photobacterium sp. SKA34]|nr:hypothetical protein SKA34_08013 [Photobacterium sp. SKA34]
MCFEITVSVKWTGKMIKDDLVNNQTKIKKISDFSIPIL